MNILEARRRVLGGEVYKKTAEGNPVSVRSLARMRPGIKLFGRSEQLTTTGAQLFNFSNAMQKKIDNWNAVNILSAPDTNDISIQWENLSGQAQSYIAIVCPFSFETGKTIYITRGTAQRFLVYDNDGQNISNTIEKTYTPNERFDGYVGIGIDIGKDFNSPLVITYDNNFSTAEPYTGGKPSPSPDYPQEIEITGKDGEIGVDVYGGNFLTDTTDKVIFGDVGDTVNDVKALWSIVPNKNLLDKELVFSFDSDSNKGIDFLCQTSMIVGNSRKWSGGTRKQITKGRNYFSVAKAFDEIPEGNISNFYVQLRIGSEPTEAIQFTVSNLMLNIGSTALPFEPYKQPQSLTVQTPNGLPGIPVDSGGNYTDESGQQWISDEVDYRRRKYVRRIGIDNLRDCVWSVSWNDNPDYNIDGTFLVFTQKFNGVVSPSIGKRSFCTHFRMLQKSILSNPDIGMESGQDSNFNIAFRVPSTLANSISEWEQWLQENDVVFTYVLATPIETDLSQEQLSAYANLHTNRPTTVVSATDDVGLRLTYKTKKFLEVTD